MNILKFKMISSVFSIAILLIVAILMFMLMIATVDAAIVSSAKIIENNGKVGVEKSPVAEPQGDVSKKFKKVKTYTLTFNANGGKIGTKTKKLSYKKSYGTLPKPTRSGYKFEGWYTKKSGGKKVSATTKMSAKNTVVYAQWKRVLSTGEKKLVGTWSEYYNGISYYYDFRADGTFSKNMEQTFDVSDYAIRDFYILSRGHWSMSGDKIHMTQRKSISWDSYDEYKPNSKIRGPASDRVWKDAGNMYMSIKWRETSYDGLKRFEDLSTEKIVYDGVPLSFGPILTNRPLPSWLYM